MGTYYINNRQEILERMKVDRTLEGGNGIVYRIFGGNGSYVGSTTMKLNLRFSLHKYAFKRFTTGKTTMYCSSFEILKGPNCEIEELERVNVSELNERESYWSNIFKSVNKNKINCKVKENRYSYMKNWRDTNNPENVERREWKRLNKIKI